MATEKNFNGTTPAAPANARNATWQVATTASGTDPATGQPVFPASCFQTDMVGDTGSGGADGLVPAPGAGTAAAGKFLKADGTWEVPAAPTGYATIVGVQEESYIYSADTGTANAYAVTLSPVPTIVAGSSVTFKAANANTGTSTLSVNGGTATAIHKNGSSPLSGGDIQAGQIIHATFDGTYWQISAVPAATTVPAVPRGFNSIMIASGTLQINLPAGCKVGDFAVLFIMNGGGSGLAGAGVPSGWTEYTNNFPFSFSCAKILSGTDISNGHIAIPGSINVWLQVSIAVYDGPTGGVREADPGGSSGSSFSISTSSAVESTDIGLFFASSLTTAGGSMTASPGVSEGSPTLSNGVSQLISLGLLSAGVNTVSCTLVNGASGGPTEGVFFVIMAGPSGVGTVTSVGLTVPSRQSVSGSPVTSAGTLAITDNTQSANLVFAGPSSGSAAAPTFRALVSADVPSSLTNPMTTEGDIIYGGASGAPTRLGAGTSGQVLTSAGSGAPPTWAAGGGGGGGGNTCPAVSTFSWVNQGSATTKQTLASGPILLAVPYNATLQWRYLVIAQPSTPYKIMMQSQMLCLNTTNRSGNQTAGICFSDGTKFVNFETLLQSAGVVLLTRQLTSFNESSGGTATNLTTQATNGPLSNYFGPIWYQIRNDGTTLYFDVSVDGSNFINLTTEAIGSFLTPTQVGFGILANDSSTSTSMSVINWLTVNNATL